MKKRIAVLLLCSFLLVLLAGCAGSKTEDTIEDAEIRIGALTGPTAMGLMNYFSESESAPVLAGSADELTPLILQGELDIAAVPVNLASVLYNKTGGAVKMLAVNVLGVLYIAEYGSEEIQSVQDLRGKTVYATGKGSTPEYFLRYALQENGLSEEDVVIEWKSEPSEVAALLKQEGHGIAMLPQPYVTAAGAQLGEGFRVALSVSELWQAAENGTPCTTACLVVCSGFAQTHPEQVSAFLEEYKASAEWVNAHPAEAGALCEQYGFIKAPVAEKAIPECGIVCLAGAEMRSAAENCLNVIYAQNPAAVGGNLPESDFYYGAE